MILNRKAVITVSLLVLLIIATAIIRGVLLGGATPVKLAPAAPLVGAISQSLITSSSQDGNLPAAAKDFTVKSTQYFDNQSWAVSSIESNSVKTDAALLIMKKEGGVYQVVLGPGTAFPSGVLQNLPPDVAQYLTTQGVIYEPTSN